MLDRWAKKWGIAPEALRELRGVMGMLTPEEYQEIHMGGKAVGTSEAAIQAAIRVEASQKGLRLWRNNVGALLDSRGVPVRYGLANESPEMNRKIKSSDLIGIRPVLIGPEHLGTTIGQFTAIEVKKAHWKYAGDAHERAQAKFIGVVQSMGGYAKFENRVGNL